MAARTYDYPALKLQYVRGHMSLRKLAEMNNIRSSSALIRVAREEGWEALRIDYQSRSTDKTLELLADREARRALRVSEVQDNALDMVDEALTQVRGRMKQMRPVVVGKDDEGKDIVEYDPVLAIHPKDLGKILAGVGEVTGMIRPPSRGGSGGEDGSGTNIHIPAGSDIAVMARFVKDVRAAGGPTEDPLPEGSLPSGSPGAGED